MEQQLNSSTGGWIGDDRRDEADFTSVSQTIAKPLVKCSSCLAPNSIRNNKVEINIGDEQGSVASVQFEYCEKCGWRGDVEWFD
jgi:hypothetical protein